MAAGVFQFVGRVIMFVATKMGEKSKGCAKSMVGQINGWAKSMVAQINGWAKSKVGQRLSKG